MTRHLAADDRPALVLVHGWGMHGGVWADLAARLDVAFEISAPDLPGHGAAPGISPGVFAAVVDDLAARAPASCAVAGWSLGGQLALEWARRYPQQVSHLLLIATTPVFVTREDWPHGMSPAVVRDFASAIERDPVAALQRFLLLQAQGDTCARAVARALHTALAMKAAPAPAILAQTLHWLERNDLRAGLGEIPQPALVLHGGRDTITPPAAGAYLVQHLPRGRLEVIEDAAHAPFVSDADRVCALIMDFCNER